METSPTIYQLKREDRMQILVLYFSKGGNTRKRRVAEVAGRLNP